MADLEWVFQVVDKASGPLKGIDEKLGAMPNDLKKVEDALKRVDHAAKLQGIAKMKDPLKQTQALLTAQRDKLKGLEKQNAATAKSGGELADAIGLGFIAKAATVAGLVGLLVDGFKRVGRAAIDGALGLIKFGIEASESKRAMLGALNVFEGARTEKIFGILQDMGIAAGVSADKTVEAFHKLRGAGFDSKEAQDILAASFDVAAAQGGGEKGLAAAEKFRDLISKVDILQKSGAKELRQLALDVGIGPEVLADALGKRLKVTAEQAKSMLAAGNADATELQNALLDVVQNKFDKGGKLGTKALEHVAGSVTGQSQRIKDLVSNLFEDVNTQPLVDALKKIADALKGDTGERLKVLAKNFFDLFSGIGKIDLARGLSIAVNMLEKAWTMAEVFGAAFEKAFKTEAIASVDTALSGVEKKLGIAGGSNADAWAAFGKVLGTVATAIVIVGRVLMIVDVIMQKIRDTMVQFAGSVVDAVGKAFGVLEKVGVNGADIVKGITGGVNNGKGDLTKAAVGVAQIVPDTVRSELEIKSPSKVMQELGRNTVEGYDMGLEAGPGAGFSPTIRVDAPAAAGGRGGVVVGDITISVSTAAADAAGTAEAVRDRVRAEVLQLFSEMAEA